MQLRDPLIVVLLAAMVVTAALGDVSDLIVILLVIVLNTTVGVIQQLRADRAVAALRRMAAPSARVHGDGTDVSSQPATSSPVTWSASKQATSPRRTYRSSRRSG